MQQEEDQSQLDGSWAETVDRILEDLDVSAEQVLTNQDAKPRHRNTAPVSPRLSTIMVTAVRKSTIRVLFSP